MKWIEKLVTLVVAFFLVLNVAMLLLDERFPWLFPFVFGIDLRYAVTIGFTGVAGFAVMVHKMCRKFSVGTSKSETQERQIQSGRSESQTSP